MLQDGRAPLPGRRRCPWIQAPWQAPLFPQSIGMGAKWDTAAALAGGAVTAGCGAYDGLDLGLRARSGPGKRQPMGPDLRDLGRAAGAGIDAGSGQRDWSADHTRAPF